MRVNISMAKEFHAKLKQKADEKSMSISEYLRYVLTNLWERSI